MYVDTYSQLIRDCSELLLMRYYGQEGIFYRKDARLATGWFVVGGVEFFLAPIH